MKRALVIMLAIGALTSCKSEADEWQQGWDDAPAATRNQLCEIVGSGMINDRLLEGFLAEENVDSDEFYRFLARNC